VLNTAILKNKESASEANGRILKYVEETCIQIIESNKIFRDGLIKTLFEFVQQPPNTSARTVDAVKSVQVLTSQFYCLLKLPKLHKKIEEGEHKHVFCNKDARKDFKKKFIMYAAEEVQRRNPGKAIEDLKTFIPDCIYSVHKEHSEKILSEAEKDLNSRASADSASTSKAIEEEV